jgi:hypothetical protein
MADLVQNRASNLYPENLALRWKGMTEVARVR